MIMMMIIALEKENWQIEYTWIKAHAGHERNELADKLAKEATREREICYSKSPRSETEHQEREISIKKWQQQWDNTTKGTATKEFFPKIKDKLKMKITLTPNFIPMVTVHGKTRSYLHRFRIIESPVCPCANGKQTVEHIIYDCGKLNNERKKTNSGHFKRRPLASREKRVSEQIPKTDHPFHKLN